MFFALWPDELTRRQFAEAAAALPPECRAHGVPPQNYHLTLAFLGDVAVSQREALQQIGASLRAPGSTIAFDGYEYWREPRVIVAAAHEAPAALLKLWSGLYRALQNSQVAPRFQPAPPRAHVTLARKVVQAPVLQAMSPVRWSARSFSLVSSDTSGKHSVYTVVDTWSLLDETEKP
jgi:RNA 2',3'-cyclic 3'-phosphodiesterase